MWPPRILGFRIRTYFWESELKDGLSRRILTGKMELVSADYGRWASDGSVSVYPHEPSSGSEPDRIITRDSEMVLLQDYYIQTKRRG